MIASDLVAVPVRHEFVQSNGLRFHVASCGEGEKLALLLHGFPECWLSWRHQMPLLARLGYRVWAPDLRGYGETERPPHREDYALETLMEDVAGLIDASGARQVLLAAHDWGAIIAWLFATRRLRELEHLVIMNVPHPAAAQRARGWRQLARSWYMLFFQLPRLPEWVLRRRAHETAEIFRRTGLDEETFPDEVAEVFAQTLRQPGGPKAMVDYYRALLRGGIRRQNALGYPAIETPTLMLWGEDDVALTKETTYGTEHYVKDLTLRYLPGVSHWVQQHDPETVNAMLEAWLGGRPVPEKG